MTIQAFKVTLDATDNNRSFFLTKFARDPLESVFVAFTAIARATCGQNITRNSSRARRVADWNEVISAKNGEMKQAALTTAISATAVPGGLAKRPLIGSPVELNTALSINSAMIFQTPLAGVELGPLSRLYSALRYVFASSFVSSAFIEIFSAPLTMVFSAILGFSVCCASQRNFVVMFNAVNCSRYFAAILAVATATTRYAGSFGELFQRFGYAASGATLCFHSILVNAISHDKCDQSGTSAASSRSYSLGHERSLAHVA